jgi:putative phage-type endonuclease
VTTLIPETTAPGRRVTPTAYLVLPASASRAEWLAARLGGIGSSDVANILEVGFKPPLYTYRVKRSELPPDPDEELDEALLWGTLHEETVAREWARRNRSVIRRVGLIARIDAPWMMCTLDRRVTECPLNREQRERCALEVKTRNAFVSKKWKREVPDDVLAQTLWQINVTGYDHIHVACLIGGNDYRQYTVRRVGNEDLIEDIVTATGRMWQRIKQGRPPQSSGDPDQLIDLYERLNPDRTGTVQVEGTDAVEVLAEYEAGRLQEKAGKAKKNTAKAQLVDRLGDNAVAMFADELAFSYEESGGRPSVDLELMAEQYPDAYAACVRPTLSRRIKIGKAFRQEELTDGAS